MWGFPANCENKHGNVNGNEKKEGDRGGKETRTVEKKGNELEERVSKDQMERVNTAALFHQVHEYFMFLEGRQKKEG